MNIRFGENEYRLTSRSSVLQLDDEALEIQLLANAVNIDSLEEVLSNKENTQTIKLINNGIVEQILNGYTKFDSLIKNYSATYTTDEGTEEVADIIYVYLKKPGLEAQVEENTANIEFLAIMSDIEL